MRNMALLGGWGKGLGDKLGGGQARGSTVFPKSMYCFKFRPLVACLFTQELDDKCSEL